jgi:cellobiose-specific phosphotransferase system component IIB
MAHSQVESQRFFNRYARHVGNMVLNGGMSVSMLLSSMHILAQRPCHLDATRLVKLTNASAGSYIYAVVVVLLGLCRQSLE